MGNNVLIFDMHLRKLDLFPASAHEIEPATVQLIYKYKTGL